MTIRLKSKFSTVTINKGVFTTGCPRICLREVKTLPQLQDKESDCRELSGERDLEGRRDFAFDTWEREVLASLFFLFVILILKLLKTQLTQTVIYSWMLRLSLWSWEDVASSIAVSFTTEVTCSDEVETSISKVLVTDSIITTSAVWFFLSLYCFTLLVADRTAWCLVISTTVETLFDIIGFTIHNIVFTSTISTKAAFAAAMLFRSKRRVTFHIYGRT